MANRNLDLFLIGTILSFLSSQIDIVKIPGMGIASFIILSIYVGFGLSIPLFLSIRESKKKLTISEIVKISLLNTKRSFLQVIVLAIFLFLTMLGIIIAQFIASRQTDISVFIENFFNGGEYYYWAIYPILSITIFTSIFFSIEKLSFFRSTIRSIKYSFQNIPFVMVVGAIFIISYYVSTAISDTLMEPFNLLLKVGILEYIELILISSAYVLYSQSSSNSKK